MREDRNRAELNGRRGALWTLLSLAIAAASIWAITTQVRGFSVAAFRDCLRGASIPWLAMGAACMLLHIWFEGCAILQICRSFGYPRRRLDGFAYASADIYFSAITPSATGGQPASAFFMIRDGIPGSVATVALLVNLTMYTLSIVAIGLFCFIARPSVFLGFSPFGQVMIALGSAVQCGLALLILMLLKKDALLRRMCEGLVKLLAKMKLLRRREQKLEKLREAFESYRQSVELIAGQRAMLAKAFVLNLLQRTALIAVTMCAFRATGGAGKRMLDAWAVQGFSVLGYNFVPIPGAMGVADLMLMDGFGRMMARQSAINLDLLSRALSFYGCMAISGITVLVKYLMQKVRKENR